MVLSHCSILPSPSRKVESTLTRRMKPSSSLNTSFIRSSCCNTAWICSKFYCTMVSPCSRIGGGVQSNFTMACYIRGGFKLFHSSPDDFDAHIICEVLCRTVVCLYHVIGRLTGRSRVIESRFQQRSEDILQHCLFQMSSRNMSVVVRIARCWDDRQAVRGNGN